MKIPRHFRPDTPESIAPAAVPVYTKPQAPRKRKADVPRVTERPPCDACSGEHHRPLEILKYRPRLRQWLCSHCRIQLEGPQ